jgi:alpha-methylacyl-CoA racemase
MLPLTGLRMLDLSRLLPGPYCSLIFADLGADVVKVEGPQGGDYLRHFAPSVGENSAGFVALNRNKRSIALDLKSAAGRAVFLRLVKTADVVLESFRPGVMSRLGVDYAALSVQNPRIILCSISGYGQDGPDALRAGHDINYIARAGALAYGGDMDGPPSLPGVQVGDIGGGSLLGAVAILAALQERERTGKGRLVDVSMCEGSLAFMALHLGARLAAGPDSPPLSRGDDSLNGGYACYRVYATKDGRFVSLGALEPKFWQAFCAAVGREDLVELGYLTGEAGRAAKKKVAELFAQRTREEWVAFSRDLDLCLEGVWEGDEVFADPQHTARGITFDIDDPHVGRKVTQLRVPLRFGEPPKQPAPLLGEHTDEILRASGFTPEEIAGLRDSGAVA